MSKVKTIEFFWHVRIFNVYSVFDRFDFSHTACFRDLLTTNLNPFLNFFFSLSHVILCVGVTEKK